MKKIKSICRFYLPLLLTGLLVCTMAQLGFAASESTTSSEIQVVDKDQSLIFVGVWVVYFILIGTMVLFRARVKTARGTGFKPTVGAKIMGSYGIVMAISLGVILYSLSQMSKIGQEIHQISTVDVQSMKFISHIEVAQLQQSIWLERALRYGEILAGDHADGNTQKKMDHAVEAFHKLAKESEHTTDEAIAYLGQLTAATQSEAAFLTGLVTGLKSIQVQHREFEHHADEALMLLKAKKLNEAHKLEEVIEKEEEELNHKLETFLLDTENRIEHSVAQAEHDEKTAIMWLTILAVVGLVVSQVLAWANTRSIDKPINDMSQLATKISEGNIGQRISLKRNDEIGALAQAFSQLIVYIQEMAGAADSLSNGDLTVQVHVRSKQDALATSFETMLANLNTILSDIIQNAQSLNLTSDELSSVSNHLQVEAGTLSDKSMNVSAAAEQMSANMATVAAGAEEMDATVKEIAQNAEEGRSVAAQAVEDVRSASNRVGELDSAAQEISKVIDVIMEIAEQTKLLALNATIESARAGEAGKGFAVVASEVKELAQQTNDATEKIRNQINTIQSSTENTVSEIGSITEVIGKVNDIVNSIATAVEEQSATTRDIAQNVDQAASASKTVASDIADVNAIISDVKTASVQVSGTSETLSQMGTALSDSVSSFKLAQKPAPGRAA